MELSKRVREYWGIAPFDSVRPFGTELSPKGGAFIWPAFNAAIEQIVTAVKRRKFLLVSGLACSAKSTAWAEAQRRLHEEYTGVCICQPMSLDPSCHNDQTIYHSIYYGIEPSETIDRKLRRGRDDRARQCRRLLEEANAKKTPVVFCVNDAHRCRAEFLLCAKRMWDELEGFDRLLSVVLIGQENLIKLACVHKEIDQRSEIVRMPGLGEALGDYLRWEWERVQAVQGGEGRSHFPFDDSAIEELSKLRNKSWRTSRDHPLIVNNLVCLALFKAWQQKERRINAELIAEAMRGEERATA